jgi:hypothetical protein
VDFLAGQAADGGSVDPQQPVVDLETGALGRAVCRNFDDAYPFVRPSELGMNAALPCRRSTAGPDQETN